MIKGELHYLTDTCELDTNKVKESFIEIFNAHPFGLAGGCREREDCKVENVQVECGDVARKRRDSSTDLVPLKIQFQITVDLPQNTTVSFNRTSEELIRSMEASLNNTDFDLRVNGNIITLDRSAPLVIRSIRPFCEKGQVQRGSMCGKLMEAVATRH